MQSNRLTLNVYKKDNKSKKAAALLPLLAQQCTLEFNLSTKAIIITSYCAERKKEKKQGSVKVKEFSLTEPRDKKSILIGYGLMDKRSFRFQTA
jgi:hypothetical protein